MPERIQRKRTKGWKMPPNTVSVTRPGAYGNPFTIKGAREAGYIATACFPGSRKWVETARRL